MISTGMNGGVDLVAIADQLPQTHAALAQVQADYLSVVADIAAKDIEIAKSLSGFSADALKVMADIESSDLSFSSVSIPVLSISRFAPKVKPALSRPEFFADRAIDAGSLRHLQTNLYIAQSMLLERMAEIAKSHGPAASLALYADDEAIDWLVDLFDNRSAIRLFAQTACLALRPSPEGLRGLCEGDYRASMAYQSNGCVSLLQSKKRSAA